MIRIITNDNSDHPGVAYRELFRDELVAVVPKGHSWSNKPYVVEKDFTDETVIIYEGPIETVDFFRSTLMPAGVTPKKILEIELTEATVEMIKAGYGVKVMATWAIKPYLANHEIEIVPISKKGLYRTWFMAYLKDKTWHSYYDQFIAQLISILRSVD